MIINFNKRFLTIGTVILGAYLIYQIKANEQPRFSGVETPVDSKNATYTIELDPNKPVSQRGFFEKLLLKTALPDYEGKLAEYQKGQKVVLGSKVKYKYKKEKESDFKVKEVMIDTQNMGTGLENAILGMTVGEKRLVEITEGGQNKAIYNLEVIELENK